jgi:hypothetical protein
LTTGQASLFGPVISEQAVRTKETTTAVTMSRLRRIIGVSPDKR